MCECAAVSGACTCVARAGCDMYVRVLVSETCACATPRRVLVTCTAWGLGAFAVRRRLSEVAGAAGCPGVAKLVDPAG